MITYFFYMQLWQIKANSKGSSLIAVNRYTINKKSYNILTLITRKRQWKGKYITAISLLPSLMQCSLT